MLTAVSLEQQIHSKGLLGPGLVTLLEVQECLQTKPFCFVFKKQKKPR